MTPYPCRCMPKRLLHEHISLIVLRALCHQQLKDCLYVAAQYGLWRPFMASLTCNTRITSADHFQDTRHLEFDLTGSGIHYAPGDLLTIFPCQSPAAVSAFLQRMNLDPDAWARIEPAERPLGSTVSSIQVCASSCPWQTCELRCFS